MASHNAVNGLNSPSHIWRSSVLRFSELAWISEFDLSRSGTLSLWPGRKMHSGSSALGKVGGVEFFESYNWKVYSSTPYMVIGDDIGLIHSCLFEQQDLTLTQ